MGFTASYVSRQPPRLFTLAPPGPVIHPPRISDVRRRGDVLHRNPDLTQNREPRDPYAYEVLSEQARQKAQDLMDGRGDEICRTVGIVAWRFGHSTGSDPNLDEIYS